MTFTRALEARSVRKCRIQSRTVRRKIKSWRPSKMEPIWMNGKDMIKFEESQGDYCYFDKSMNVVKINPDWQCLVGLDEMEKNSIVFDIRK